LFKFLKICIFISEVSKSELRFLMAQSDSKTQFLLSPPVAPFKLDKSSFLLR